MAASNKGKNIPIQLSSSSSEDYNADDVDTSSFSSENEASDDDDDDVYVIDDDDDDESDGSDVESDDDDGDDDDDDDDENYGVEDNFNDDDNDNDVANRVIKLLQGRRDLQELCLKECKAYLRINGLRVSGTKDECVRRIQEHWRLKDGKAEVLYPSSSFNINCTGDVCKGDIVLFKQKVYGSFDKVTRNGKLLGKRTVTGRVVKESYGAAKQQHTFTVEVLWSKGIKKLPSLFPLLVKGRNLYRLKTFRQAWKNEGERRKVLAEKHRRGTVARNKRDKRKNGMPTNKGRKSQKISHGERGSQMSYSERGTHVHRESRDKRATSSTHTTMNRHKQQRNVKQGPARNTTKGKSSKRFHKPQNPGSRSGRVSTPQSSSQLYPEAAGGSYHRTMPLSSYSAKFHPEIRYQGPTIMSTAQNDVYGHRPTGNYYGSQSPYMTQVDSRQFFSSRCAPGQRNGFLNCSTRGCYEPGSNACAISACWQCCRRMGMVCNVHR